MKYLIWYGHIGSAEGTGGVAAHYNGASVYNLASITGGHYDHDHISVY